jgi:phage-related baseplate assembly protein
MTEAIDLSRLPPPTIIDELDFEEILAELKADLLERSPELDDVLDLESEPLVKLLEVVAYRELILRAQHNERLRALLLAYAQGPSLDHIGVTYYLTERLELDPGDPDAVPPVPVTMESDADYRRRILLAFDGWSTAGPERSYVYHALGADPQVKDATSITPARGEVLITVLSREGDGTASPALIEAVQAATNDEWVAPQTDHVTVQGATINAYQSIAELEVYPGPDPEMVREEAEKQVAAWVEEQHRLGVTIVRDALLARHYVEGVRRVSLISPAEDVTCEPTEAPFAEAVEVTLG